MKAPPYIFKAEIVIPAYNAALTLRKTIDEIPTGSVDEIILVDDCSNDNTVDIARSFGITVVAHSKNLGYRTNQQSCYRMALERRVDYIIVIHPDYQYDSRLIPSAIGILKLGVCDKSG